MKDHNVDCNGNGWHLFYGENNLENRQYYTTLVQRKVSDLHTGHDRNGLKRKMLEHDAIFKNQVCELHRLYRTQRDMTEDIKTTLGHRHGDSIELSSSSSPQRFHAANGDKWHISRYPVVSCGRLPVLGTENVTSPSSCSKGNSLLSSQVRLQNDCNKDFEITEARPLKVRKKLIDLQLPADEYSDTEDANQLGTKTLDRSSFTPDQEYSSRLESCVKLSNGDVVREKMDDLHGGCNSVSNTTKSIRLADLNEPAEVEEATESSSIKIFGQFALNSAVKGIDLSAKRDSGFLDLPRNAMHKPGHGWNGSLNNFLTGTNVNGSKRLPFLYEAEHAGSSCNLVPKSVQQDKLSLHATPSKVLGQDHPGFHCADHSQETKEKERMAWELEGFHKSQDYASHTHRESSNSYMFLGSNGVAHTRSHIMSPWGKAADSSSPKLTSLHSQNLSRGLIKTLQSSVVSKDILGDNWYVNNNSHSNPVLTRNSPSYNGCYHASSSASKGSTPFGFDCLNCDRGANIESSLPVNRGMEKAFMASSCINIKPLKDLNLNEPFHENALNEAVPRQDLEIMDGKSKHENHKPLFPWLRASNSEAAIPKIDVVSISSSPPRASQGSLFDKGGTGKDLKCMYNAASSTNLRTWPNNERYGTKCAEGSLGGSIFKNLGASENKTSSLASSTPEKGNAKQEKKNFLLDINVAWEASVFECSDGSDVEEVVVEKQLDKSSSIRNFIDLNSCVTEDEDLPMPNGGSSNTPVKFVADFDLEAPAVPEEDTLPEKEKEQNVPEEDTLPEKEKEQNILSPSPHCESEQLDDEVLVSAAEAIVDMSSCQGKSIISLSSAVELESLLWFADVVSTAVRIETTSGKECSYKEIDDFEATTLLLPDTKEEDYMPKPFVPEVQVEEAGGNARSTRPRRGQARRGRQRRDFQRDILPGLVTLTRHEMTEDLQTFGGLMRATGHAWNSGSTRRNGGTRGRRRKAVELAHDSAPVGFCTQQMNNERNSLEDRRSLTGWGKTTRRPRRQRCPLNNAPTAELT